MKGSIDKEAPLAREKASAIRLVLVDDHEVVRVGLRTLLDRARSIQVVGEAGTMADAVITAARLKPDVVVMDVRLPDGNGVEACREIRATCPETRVLFLTSFADHQAVLAAICGGADGYLLKEIGGEALVRAVRTVAGGKSVLDPAVTEPILAHMRTTGDSGGDPLSPQERRVLAHVADGKTNREIATILGLSDKTVKSYLSHIFQKLQVTRRSQAAVMFARRSLE